MDSLQSKIPINTMTVYFGIFKEPRGLIRLLQFIFAIFAFATACNGGSGLSITNSANDQLVSASWSYPYHLSDTPINTNPYLNTTPPFLSSSNDIKPSAEFFVFTGVTSMLIALGFITIYVLMDLQYRNNERFPIIDLIITLIWTIFWIAGSSAWAQGVSNLRSQTSQDYINSLVPNYTDPTIYSFTSGTYANPTVSVIFGFLNFLLWTGCLWFVYKETRFFKVRTAQQQQPQNNNFSNFAPSNMQQQQQPGVLGTMG